MGDFLFWLGFTSLGASIVLVVIFVLNIFRKKPKKKFILSALACFVAFIVFAIAGAQVDYKNMTPEERAEYDSRAAAESESREAAKAAKEATKAQEKAAKEAAKKQETTTERVIEQSVQLIMKSANISETQARTVLADFKAVGIDTITYCEALSSDGTDKSFKFSSDKVSGTLIISNGKTSYISSGGVELFNSKKGGALADVNDYYLSSYEKNYYKGMAEQHVKQFLKAPSTASFPDLTDASSWIVSRYKDTVTVYAWVDSQNSYGAMLRSDFTVQMSYSSEGTVLTYAEVENRVLYGSFVSY